ncbi:MAG: L-rhamnose isomerase [Lentisphaeria bacterium]|nr:L-rhamnose isomerase [Lentisphaeria bacterium]
MPFKPMTGAEIKQRYELAKKYFAELGVDTDKALDTLAKTPISLHCWQGDDVHGFEIHETSVGSGGIMSTGNYPGCAMNADQLRADAEVALKLIPGLKRFNLHAIYAETNGKSVDRDEITPEHFKNWMKWAKKQGLALDFNPTFFAHPLANSGYTLSSTDKRIRDFWIRHDKQCREIAAAMGKAQGSPCVVNHWVPDGAKDQPVDRLTPRKHLKDSYDEIFSVKYNPKYIRDGVESKLFGIGAEDYTVGSHEFYMSYVGSRPAQDVMLTFDMGHFHPTETIHDKVASIVPFQKELLLHVSRGIRWDSDHVVNFNDDLRNLFLQLVRCNFLSKTYIALDFFDGAIDRIGAWVVGSRATQKALLFALLEPTAILKKFEKDNDNAMKMALLEELKGAPWEAVYDEFCNRSKVTVGNAWLNDLYDYDRKVARHR